MSGPAPTLNVTAMSRTKQIYEGQAYSVTSYNDLGIFDVLPQHANFVSIIHNSVTIRTPNDETKSFDLERGVIYVLANKVKIFVGI